MNYGERGFEQIQTDSGPAFRKNELDDLVRGVSRSLEFRPRGSVFTLKETMLDQKLGRSVQGREYLGSLMFMITLTSGDNGLPSTVLRYRAPAEDQSPSDVFERPIEDIVKGLRKPSFEYFAADGGDRFHAFEYINGRLFQYKVRSSQAHPQSYFTEQRKSATMSSNLVEVIQLYQQKGQKIFTLPFESGETSSGDEGEAFQAFEGLFGDKSRRWGVGMADELRKINRDFLSKMVGAALAREQLNMSVQEQAKFLDDLNIVVLANLPENFDVTEGSQDLAILVQTIGHSLADTLGGYDYYLQNSSTTNISINRNSDGSYRTELIDAKDEPIHQLGTVEDGPQLFGGVEYSLTPVSTDPNRLLLAVNDRMRAARSFTSEFSTQIDMAEVTAAMLDSDPKSWARVSGLLNVDISPQ